MAAEEAVAAAAATPHAPPTADGFADAAAPTPLGNKQQHAAAAAAAAADPSSPPPSDGDVPVVRQRHEWDCGIACALMVLKALRLRQRQRRRQGGGNLGDGDVGDGDASGGVGSDASGRRRADNAARAPCATASRPQTRVGYGELLASLGTTSVWTIDVAHALARHAPPRASVSLLTRVAGADPAHGGDPFYSPAWDDDAPRVRRLFAEAGAAGVRVEERGVSLGEIVRLVGGGVEGDGGDGEGDRDSDGGGSGGGGISSDDPERPASRDRPRRPRRPGRRFLIALVDKRITDPDGWRAMLEAQRRAAAKTAAAAAAAAVANRLGAGDTPSAVEAGASSAIGDGKRGSSPSAQVPPGKRQQQAAPADAAAAPVPASAPHHRASAQPGVYMGHYLLVCGYSARRRAFLVHDPDPSRPSRVWLDERTFEAGRRAKGTDEDLIVVEEGEEEEGDSDSE